MKKDTIIPFQNDFLLTVILVQHEWSIVTFLSAGPDLCSVEVHLSVLLLFTLVISNCYNVNLKSIGLRKMSGINTAHFV